MTTGSPLDADRWAGPFFPEERILWRGTPGPGFAAGPTHLLSSVLGLVTLAIALALAFDRVKLVGIDFDTVGRRLWAAGLFAGIGLYQVAGKYLLSGALRPYRRYLLTTHRAGILTLLGPLRWRRVYRIGQGSEIAVSDPPQSAIWFGPGPWVRQTAAPWIGFERIAEFDEVLRLFNGITEGGR